MKCLWIILLCGIASAQTLDLRDPALIERGGAGFAKSCAVGYCHGSEGRSARGPALQGKDYEPKRLFAMTHDGIEGTSMPAWKGILPNEEIWAITAYVLSLGSKPVAPELAMVDLSDLEAEASKPLSAEAQRGKALFFDLTREKRCGLCHQIDGQGTAIGPNLAVSANDKSAAELQGHIREPGAAVAFGFEQAEVRTRAGEIVRGILAERNEEVVRIYDFAALPPPLRTFAADEIRRVRSRQRSAMPSGWMEVYSADELQAIATYLTEL